MLTAVTFGRNLREARDRANLSQAALAARAVVSKSTIVRIESGQSKRPSQDTIARLAKGLGVSITTLIGNRLGAHPVDDIHDEDAALVKIGLQVSAE